jgi:hypothetical protein
MMIGCGKGWDVDMLWRSRVLQTDPHVPNCSILSLCGIEDSHGYVVCVCAGEAEGGESAVCCICHEELAPLESIQEEEAVEEREEREEKEEEREERQEGGESSDVSEVLDCDHKVRRRIHLELSNSMVEDVERKGGEWGGVRGSMESQHVGCLQDMCSPLCMMVYIF